MIPEPIAAWLESQSGLEFVLTTGGVCALLWAAWKFLKAVFPGVKNFIVFLDALAKLPVFMETTTNTLHRDEKIVMEVRHEVLPNNGKSMRDEQVTSALRIAKIEAKLSKDYGRVDEMDREIAYREERGLGIPTTTSPNLPVGQPAESAKDIEP